MINTNNLPEINWDELNTPEATAELGLTEFFEIDCDELEFPFLIKEHPTATLIKNIDMKKEYLRTRKNTPHSFNLFGVDASREEGKIYPRPFINPTCSECILNTNSVWTKRTVKNGIEIMGLKPSIKTNRMYCDGLMGTKELKKCCKDNGLKKYSSKSKIELIKMLMSI